MKFSESWLRDFVSPTLTGEDLSHLLTMAGLEVEEEQTVAPPFDSVVVARVLEVKKHENADRLNVCQVDIGDGNPRQIVCGAPNVAPGLKVPCALPGAQLPGGLTIREAAVRGVKSAGMLCSARELGISEEASGLMLLPEPLPLGENLRHALDLDDCLRTLKLTPNRADCLSLTGIAREVGALTGAAVQYPEVSPVAVTSSEKREIVLDAPQACPLYTGRVISGVDAKAPTPEWMRRRLERCGVRSISALVDITNYVMLKFGQPLHAFDNARLQGALHVRMGLPDEKLLLLNEQTVAIDPDVLVIADEQKPLALAGIMGGEESGITLETSELFLESAFFSPAAVAGRARRYDFVSDASHRFERGVDFAGAERALEGATALILEICGGNAGPVSIAQAELPTRSPVRLRAARAARVLGTALAGEEIATLFTRLALPFVREGKDADFIVTPPSWRFDLEREEDLIEELARLHGYENIPVRPPRAALSMMPQPEAERPLHHLRQRLVNAGYQEVVNFAFVEAAWEADFAANAAPLKLANPIAAQMSVMRSTLIGGLVANLATNLKRQQSRVRLFETGRCFLRKNPSGSVAETGDAFSRIEQPWSLAGIAYGDAFPEQWGHGARRVDFFDVKGDLESLCAPFVLQSEETRHAALHPGRAASLNLHGRWIGVLGELHPKWVQKYELPAPPVLFELDLSALMRGSVPVHSEISRFPLVIRDLAFEVDHDIEWQDLLGALEKGSPPWVREIRLFDLYTGEGIAKGKKSLAIRIVMQDTQRTLQDAEVADLINNLVRCLETGFGVRLRA
ncbi:MAG: phenylalanine--tRNA ligase subunit beta [Betaproteobacteria bacterium]|nr:phenylalanine--tRNA ligase subunit beta [Betaproteobacteria bacterium]